MFVKMALNANIKAFIAYSSKLVSMMIIYLAKKAWILLLLIVKLIILIKYLNFVNIIVKNSTKMLSKQTEVNKFAIK